MFPHSGIKSTPNEEPAPNEGQAAERALGTHDIRAPEREPLMDGNPRTAGVLFSTTEIDMWGVTRSARKLEDAFWISSRPSHALLFQLLDPFGCSA